MEKILTGKEYVITDASFDRLLVNETTGIGDQERKVFDRAAAMAVLREDKSLSARLLSAAESEMVYMGAYSRQRGAVDGISGTFGMRMDRTADTPRVTGDNMAGRFLSSLADEIRRELAENGIVENAVRDSRVMVDWTPAGEYISDVSYHEESGAKYIHVDRYIPKRFTFDANRSGTTGHAERRSADDIPFHTFECPFGTDSRSKIVVDTAAEASILYEKGIRGEIDWLKFFRDMRDEGRLNRMSDRQMEQYATDYRAQFDWMREQIATRSDELSALPIVATSLLIPDSSMGRSVYDPEHAPSPAHVLEHYIHNPHLLSGISESYVTRALSAPDKMEQTHFNLPEGAKTLTVVIAGSDTIGGREPGTRATQSAVSSYTVDKATGALKETGKTRKSVLQFKSEAQVEADYRALSARLDSILSGVGEDVSVRFVVGKTVGTPKMVERYVKEHGGRNLDWDFFRDTLKTRSDKGGAAAIESVAVDHFDECWPVLVGYLDKVNIALDKMDEDSITVFSRSSGLGGDAAVIFSEGADMSNRYILEKGSLAAGEGLPVIHVLDNMTEEAQLQSLRSGSVLSLKTSGDEDFGESLFTGREKTQWDMTADKGVVPGLAVGSVSIPLVMQKNTVPVTVGGLPFNTVFGAFTALMETESGKATPERLRHIALAESVSDSSERLVSLLSAYKEASKGLNDQAEERSMRKAVRLFSNADHNFENLLASFDGKEVMERSGIQAGKLFVDTEGRGHNRFGVVLAHESEIVISQREALRQKAEEMQRKAIEEAAKAQKIRNTQKAEGQKVTGGLPVLADAMDAVWFTGTAKPEGLLLEDNRKSFQAWDDEDGRDPLCREKVQRQFFTDADGDRFSNDFVYLSASNLLFTTGLSRPKNRASSRDLTGCTRVDPETGREYTCAFGIPVMHNWDCNEPGNAQGMPCSYRMDNENAAFRNSIILADTQARRVALQYGLALCAEAKEGRNGEMYYALSRVFRSKIFGIPKDDGALIDPATGKRVYLEKTVEVSRANSYKSETHEKSSEVEIRRALEAKERQKTEKKEKVWMDNPHAAPLNEAAVKRYMEILQNGAELPLNCIPLPSSDYTYSDIEGSKELAQRRFVVDFNMSLDMANSLAIALGKPLRFPLDEKGRIDLGPNVPEEFRAIAEQSVDAFLGIRRDNLLEGALPAVNRISMYEASKSGMESTGKVMYMRPSDLVYAFGRYDFKEVEVRSAPMHEMAFRFDDGSTLKLTDPRLSGRLDKDDVNGYLSYSKNDERKFTVKSSDPENVDRQMAVISAYIERAKSIRVEAALFEEGAKETRDLSLDGFIDLKSSNSLEHASNEWEMEGREQKPWETVGRFNGIDEEHVYDGRVDAGDAFKGYAMMRYILPDGTQSGWRVITDRELAKEVVFSNVSRVYRSDEFVPASKHVIDMLLTAEAVKASGGAFRNLDFKPRRQEAQDDKVVEIKRTEMPKSAKPEDTKTVEKVNVYSGAGEHAELSNLAIRRFKVDINKFTKKHGAR